MGITTYDDLDMQNISNQTSSMMQRLGANTADEATQKLAEAAKQTNYLQLSTMVTNSIDAKARHDAAFQKNTDLLAQMNESWNANRYILNSLDKETKRISSLDSQAKRDIYKLRQDELHLSYMGSFYDFGSRAIIFTMFFTLLALIPVALWRADRLNGLVVIIGVGVLAVLYAIVMLFSFTNVGGRRKGAWKKYYWKAGKAVQNAKGNQGNCPNTMYA